MLALVLLAGCGGLGGPGVEYAPADFFAGEPDLAVAQAVAADDAEEVRRLVAAGADVDASGKGGMTLLQYAILNRRLEPVRVLLELGADAEKLGDGGESAVHIAAFASDLAYLDALLDAGADPNVRDRTGSVPLVRAILNSNQTQFDRLLEEPDLDVNLANTNDDAPIHTAGRTNAGRMILVLLNRGADPRATNATGATFQDYYFTFPENVQNERSKAEHREVAAWLTAHDVPLHPNAPR